MALYDNKRYRGLKVREGEYVPDIGIDYPEDDPMAHMVPIVKVRELKFDDSYPYYERGLKFFLGQIVTYFIVFCPLYIVNKLHFGMKIKGRDCLRRHRADFRKGLVSVSNHCYRYDGAAISVALRHWLWIPMLSEHFETGNGWLLKHFGGVPLTDGSLGAVKKFNEAFDRRHAEGGWVHIFAEARSWLFYKPLRPWQKGAFTMAYRWNVPILPINLSFRERKGIYRLFGKRETPLITVNIGEPVFPDTSRPRRQEVDRLLHDTFSAVCRLGGIEHNSWPAEQNEN